MVYVCVCGLKNRMCDDLCDGDGLIPVANDCLLQQYLAFFIFDPIYFLCFPCPDFDFTETELCPTRTSPRKTNFHFLLRFV